ncbi:unnamed protein product [Ambrosiozyma monospora]|uniref:Unnamed protein product n=1 Tax=Ambrosiozyma monospora TaxID=43982 RepID=A0A9W6YZJ2_AMBMO|nr:unnamed protein product [Ambrosiozyma monospora]
MRGTSSSVTNGATVDSPHKKGKSSIAYLLKDDHKDKSRLTGTKHTFQPGRANTGAAGAQYIPPPNLALSDPNVGNTNELNWLIDDLLMEF